jgi:class 3 adenylate cyclase
VRPRECSSCGRESPDEARFCPNCGAPLDAPAAGVDERRVVSVIFVDLVGFTGRAERLDPEDVRAVLAPYHAQVRREIESFGGVVEKFIGDAVMGVFGAPVAHGDDAERAVRAALAIADLAGEVGGGLELRVAVNTGEAVVSLAARPEAGESMVAGDVVNTASRLQSAAPVNGVIVGEETYTSTNTAIRYEPADPVVAKGKEHPVPAWIACGTIVEAGSRPIEARRIVGRRLELAILDALWQRSTTARLPTLVSLIGPAGVGKSTLASRFCDTAAANGARILKGRTLPYRESGAYGALSTQLMGLTGVFESDTAEVASAKLRESATALLAGTDSDAETVAADLAAVVGVSAGASGNRDALFRSVREVFEAAAREQPTVLVYEDIHWADASLLDVVLACAGLMGRVPLLILALARPELVDARPDWAAGLPEVLMLTLGPLDEVEARELVVRAMGDADQADEVLRIAEGNPLFIEQLAAGIGQTPPGKLPTTVREIVAARLDALPRDERALLLDASVVGKVFWADALRSMTSDPSPVGHLLDQLERRDLIRRETTSLIEGKPQFSFTHAVIREVAYDMLSRADRARRHALVAEFFGAETGGSSEAVGAMARHWRAAGDNERAVEQLLRAAEVADAGWAKDHAAYLYREALALIPADDTDRRRSIQRKVAIASAAALHVPEIRRRGSPQA